MMAFHGGRGSMPEKRPEFDPDSATPEQIVEHYREDLLFRDITVSIERTAGTRHQVDPEDELVVTLEAYATRLADTRQYFDSLGDAVGFPADRSMYRPAREFADFLAERDGQDTWMSSMNEELERRERHIMLARHDLDIRMLPDRD